MRYRRTVMLSLVAALLFAPTLAAAGDIWTEPEPGVRHLTRVAEYDHTPGDTYRAWGLVIDLTHPAVEVEATPPDQKGGTVSDFANRNGLAAAWNANFYANTTTPCGMMVGAGKVWQTAYDDGCDSAVGVGAEKAAVVVDPPLKGPVPEGWMEDVVSGNPGPILVDGQPQFSYGCSPWCAYQPRTGLGVDKTGTKLIVAVIDGRSTKSVGAGLDDLAMFMKDMGAWDAVNLDGGGSSTMFVSGEGGVVNSPSGGAERNVCCHMGIEINDVAKPSGYGAEVVDQSPAPTLQPGETAQVWVEYKNTGSQSWRSEEPYRVNLGTQKPQDRDSAFAAPGWAKPARVGPVEGPVAPGETVRWTFDVRAPMTPGSYDEAFAPVVEDVTWLDGATVEWSFTVEGVAPMDTGIADTSRPAPPDTGRTVDTTVRDDETDTRSSAPARDSGRSGGASSVQTTSTCSTSPPGSPWGIPLVLAAACFVARRRKR